MLNDQINADLKGAMKAQDAETLSTLRMVKSALKNKQIDLMRELTDDEATGVLKSQIKQLREVEETAQKAQRAQMAEDAVREIRILEKYLPAQMDDATLAQIVKDAVVASGATAKADAGRAMGAAMKAVAGRADGGRVKQIVEGLLLSLVLSVPLVLALPRPIFAAARDAAFVSSGARIMRVFLMLMGIVSVNFIIMGAVSVMTASGRDHGHHHGIQQMAMGIFGTIFLAGLVVIVTVALQRLG